MKLKLYLLMYLLSDSGIELVIDELVSVMVMDGLMAPPRPYSATVGAQTQQIVRLGRWVKVSLKSQILVHKYWTIDHFCTPV